MLEIQDILDTARSASYLDIDNEVRLRTRLYNKRDYFNFLIVNFPFICSNIPAASAYGVLYISQFQSLWFLSMIEGCCQQGIH
jgi:hypothetical protein